MDREQSYNPIVLMKVENRRAPARGGHGIHWREGGSRRTNLLKGDITRLRTRNRMYTDINRIAELAKEDPKRQFFSIAHLITVEKMYEAFRSLRKDASAGIDGVTYKQYEVNAEEKIRQLHQRLKEGKYQVQPAPHSLSSATILVWLSPPNSSAYPKGVHSTISPGRS